MYARLKVGPLNAFSAQPLKRSEDVRQMDGTGWTDDVKKEEYIGGCTGKETAQDLKVELRGAATGSMPGYVCLWVE